ncbi:MAG: hypothetical protein HYU66_19540 [Armatimonadetes bacterium]|nr:hypothetical protein [Armatimonadota bacterium]
MLWRDDAPQRQVAAIAAGRVGGTGSPATGRDAAGDGDGLLGFDQQVAADLPGAARGHIRQHARDVRRAAANRDIPLATHPFALRHGEL